MKIRTTAIVLAAGQGKRMKSDTAKQYLLLKDKPVLYYSLKAFQESLIDDIVLVTGANEMENVRQNIVETYGFTKVTAIVEGGKERYHSVFHGLQAVYCDRKQELVPHYCYIHDGARPFVTGDMIQRALTCVQQEDACVMGMPVKDTIKIADQNGYAQSTPNRNLVWKVQTPQVFKFSLIYDAYTKLMEQEEELLKQGQVITDDACVVELLTSKKVKLVEGSYENIKITTPDDLKIAETFLE